MPPRPLAAMRRLAFVPTLLVLALAASGRVSLLLLDLTVAAGVFELALARRAPPAGRLLLAEGLAGLGLAAMLLFFGLQGVPAPLPASAALAVLLLASTPVWLIGAEHDRRPQPARSPRIDRLLTAMAPSRALALLLVYHLALLALAVGAFRPAWGYVWLAGAASGIAVVPVVLLSLGSGRCGRIGTAVALAGCGAALLWYAASIAVASEQGRALPWDELRLRLAEPGGWRVLAEAVGSVTFASAAVAFLGSYLLLERLLRRLSPETSLLASVKLPASAATFGMLLIAQPAVYDPAFAGYRESTTAPWSWLQSRPQRSVRLDLEFARRLRRRAEPPLWAEGPSTPLAALAGRYPNRSIVVVLMESQAARLLPGLGEAAHGYSAAQPELARLAASGVLFTRYFAEGMPTHSALWSVLTGLPNPPSSLLDTYRAPQAAGVGRTAEFVASGYRVDWMCPASPRFDNWDRLMTAAGARWWIANQELRGLDRRYWTSWGMPDEQLYQLALARYLSRPAASRGTGYLLGLLTVSNHSPFRLPPGRDGVALPADHLGGTRYADLAVGRFVDRLLALPPEQRPIVFLTADTAQLDGLREYGPLGIRSPEALRIPGLLLLPDAGAAGTRFSGVFCHQDLLDLLYQLVSPARAPGPRKFLDRHRVVGVALGGGLAYSDAQLCAADEAVHCYAVENGWQLRPVATAAAAPLVSALRQYAADDAALWRAAVAAAGRR